MARTLSILVVIAAMLVADAGKSEARPAADERGFETVSIPLIAEGKPGELAGDRRVPRRACEMIAAVTRGGR